MKVSEIGQKSHSIDVKAVPSRTWGGFFGLLSTLFVALLGCTDVCAANGFKVTIPANWRRVEESKDGAAYQNLRSSNRQTIVLRRVPIGAPTSLNIERLAALKNEIQKVREGVLTSIGISSYRILDFRSRASRAPGFEGIVTIESSYRGANRQEVRSVERHFLTKREVFQITYTEESLAIRNRDQIEVLFENLKPIYRPGKGRSASTLELFGLATAVAAEVSSAPPSRAGGDSSDQSSVCGTKGPRVFNLRDSETRSRCEKLVVASELRTPEDPPLFSSDGSSQLPWGCFEGGKEIVKGTARAIWKAYTGYVKSMSGYSIYKYYTDPVFKAESDAESIAIAEGINHPISFAQRKAHELYCFVSNKVEAFPCLKPQAQWKVLCKLAVDAGLTVAAGAGVIKLVRGYMDVAEAADLANLASRDVAEVAKAGENTAQAAAAPKSAPRLPAPENTSLSVEPTKAPEAMPVSKFSHGSNPVDMEFAPGRNPYATDPNHRMQGRFLKRMGAEVDENGVRIANPKQVVQNINNHIEQEIKAGKIKPEDAMFWADTYVGPDGKLVFVRAGEAVPKELQRFIESEFRIQGRDSIGRNIYVRSTAENEHLQQATGLLANPDYYYGLSRGYFPGTYDIRRVGLRGLREPPVSEPAFHHDLAHLGGMTDSLEGMVAFRRAARKVWQDWKGAVPESTDKRLFYVNELLPSLKPGASGRLNEVVANAGLNPNSLVDFNEAVKSVNALSKEKIDALADSTLKLHDETRLPFGGALRSGGTPPSGLSRLDRLASQVRHAAEADKKFRNVDSKDPRYQLGDYNVVDQMHKDLREKLAEYLFANRALSETNIHGWFDFASSTSELAGPYHRFLCEGAVREVYQFFCP